MARYVSASLLADGPGRVPAVPSEDGVTVRELIAQIRAAWGTACRISESTEAR